MRVLVDTSVWSLALRRSAIPGPEAQEMRRLVGQHQAHIIGAIRQEVLSGIREQVQFDRLESHLRAFPDVPTLPDDYVRAAAFYNLCRSRGLQGSNTDYLICAVAARSSLVVFTTDRDFDRYAEHLPIRLHAISPSG